MPVALHRAPKVRSIPAWAEGPGLSRACNRRAESPLYRPGFQPLANRCCPIPGAAPQAGMGRTFGAASGFYQLQLLVVLVWFFLLIGNVQGEEPKVTADSRFELQTHRGKAVYLAEALRRLHNVQSVDEAKERTLAIETKDGTLIPLVEDVRGRAFRNDERLRKMNIEVLIRKFKGSPAGQVIRLYEITDEGKFEIDYWCEICSIAMYELKICECCQGEIELRKTKVK
jgi:hypothetical protein